MKNILIYPFFKTSYALVKYLSKIFKVEVCSLSGTSLIGKDIGFALNKLESGIIVKSLDDTDLNKIDEVFLLDIESLNLIEGIESVIETFLSYNLTIKSFKDFKMNDIYIKGYKNEYQKCQYNSFYNFNIPVIGVCGLFESLDTNELCLDIKYDLEKRGYKTATISGDDKLALVGVDVYDFYSIGETIENKILDLNSFMKKIILHRKPDVLIISIPDGIGRVNDYFMNKFGIYVDILMKIVTFDYFILNIPFNYVDESYFQEINNYFYKKHDCKIDAFHINNELAKFKRELIVKEQDNTYCDYNKFPEDEIRSIENFVISDYFSSDGSITIINDIVKKLSEED